MKLIVSVACFNEIAGLCEKEGVKINSNGTITLEKGLFLVPPIDYRLVTIRRDCIIEASKICVAQDEDIVDCANRIYQYVLNEKL